MQGAFRDVSDALAARQWLARQLAIAQEGQAAQAERARLSQLRYDNGSSAFLDVLDAQRALFATQQALARTQLAQRQNQVELYKALGGGWVPAPQVPERADAPGLQTTAAPLL